MLDGGDQAFGAAVEVASCLAPFGHCGFAQRRIASYEVQCGIAKLVAEFVELVGEITEAGVRNEASDTAQEREAGAFDGGLHPGFDQGEGRERVTRDEAFVTKLDESVGNVSGIKAEVFGIEAFATAPVTDGGCDKDSTAADAVEECGVLSMVLIHMNLGCGSVLFVFRLRVAVPERVWFMVREKRKRRLR